jgi:hypothetical protein
MWFLLGPGRIKRGLTNRSLARSTLKGVHFYLRLLALFFGNMQPASASHRVDPGYLKATLVCPCMF